VPATKKRQIKVLLVDDHPVVREGVRSSLLRYAQVEVIGEASDGKEAIDKIKSLSPDIVLMDISMPHTSGLDVMNYLKKTGSNVKVIMLTMHDSAEYIRQIVRSGARGYVLKDVYPTDLVRAIEAVHGGEAFFSPAVNRTILNDYIQGEQTHSHDEATKLSSRERQVLALIAEGLANKEIADRLFVTVRTVETHRERIMRKLNIHNTAGLTRFAIAHGMVKLE
jgi:two-component system nitrate/nitrite response regulator NarL